MGAYSVSLDHKASANRIFLVITFIFSIWCNAAFFRNISNSNTAVLIWRISSLAAWSFGSSAIVHFAALLRNEGNKLKPAVILSIYLPAVIIFIIQILSIAGFLYERSSTIGFLMEYIISILFYLIMILITFIILIKWTFKTGSERIRRLSTIIIVSLGLTTVFIFFYGFIIPSKIDFILPFILPVFPISWISAMWVAITRLHLLEFKPSMAKFELLNNVQDLVIITDKYGKIIEANHQIEKKLGYKPEVIEGSSYKDYIASADDKPMLRCSDGSLLAVRILKTDVHDSFGDLAGSVISAQDLTLENEYKKLSITDALTGIYNRARIDEVLAHEFGTNKRYTRQFSVILFDVDNFKKINDNLGHQSGDAVLCRIAASVKDVLREGDTFGRYGGEEFLIILPETDSENGFAVAEKIRKQIESLSFDKLNNVTVSCGISSCRPEDSSFEDIVSRADSAMYEAKSAGKNRSITF